MRKSTIQEVVESLSDEDEIDIDEFLDRIYLLQKIEEGEHQIADGKTISHEELLREMKPWLE